MMQQKTFESKDQSLHDIVSILSKREGKTDFLFFFFNERFVDCEANSCRLKE